MSDLPDNVYLGAPCKRGHDGLRYKASRACVECQKVHGARGRNVRSPSVETWLGLHGTDGWRDIPGYEGRYQAHPDGLVRSLPRAKARGGILRQHPAKGGYMRVGFCGEGPLGPTPLVHLIIMLTFVGPRPPDKETGHRDGVASHNWLSNLRYITKIENEADKVKHGTNRPGRRAEVSHVGN